MREQFEQLDRTSIIERKMDQRNEAFPLLSAPLVGETLKNTPTCRVRREILKGVIKKKKKKKKKRKEKKRYGAGYEVLSRVAEDFSRKSREKREIESYVIRRGRRFKRVRAMLAHWFLRAFLRIVLAFVFRAPFA
jgi:hypothetical protein